MPGAHHVDHDLAGGRRPGVAGPDGRGGQHRHHRQVGPQRGPLLEHLGGVVAVAAVDLGPVALGRQPPAAERPDGRRARGHHRPLHPGQPRRLEQASGAGHVDRLHLPPVPWRERIGRRHVHQEAAAAERRHQGATVAHVSADHGEAGPRREPARRATHQRPDAVPGLQQRVEHVPAHEAGGPGEEDLVTHQQHAYAPPGRVVFGGRRRTAAVRASARRHCAAACASPHCDDAPHRRWRPMIPCSQSHAISRSCSGDPAPAGG